MAGPRRSAHFLKQGLPFVSMMVAGSVGLSFLLQGRKDLEKVKDEEEWAAISVSKNLTRETKLPELLRRKKPGDLNQELEAMKQKLDIDSYENKRLPRELLKD